MGGYSSIGLVKGQLIPVANLKGKLSVPLYSHCEHEEYDGEYTIVPGEEQQILHTANRVLLNDIVVEASQGVMPPNSSMATDDDIDNLIDEIFGEDTTPNPDEPVYDADDIATSEELDDVITGVFGDNSAQ